MVGESGWYRGRKARPLGDGLLCFIEGEVSWRDWSQDGRAQHAVPLRGCIFGWMEIVDM